MRVRASKGQVVMEFDHPDKDHVHSQLQWFLARFGFHELADVKVNDVRCLKPPCPEE